MNAPYFWVKFVMLSFCLTIILSYVIIVKTWPWFASWGEFKQHSVYLYPAFKNLIIGDNDKWLLYLNYLHRSGYMVEFYLHSITPILIAAISSFYFSFNILSVSNEKDAYIHIQGPKLLKAKKAYRDGRAQYKTEQKDSKKIVQGLFLHPQLQISEQRELGNIFVFGQQGSGKSVIIKPIIKESIERGDQVLIYDQKREYTALFYNTDTILISPTDKRGTVWDISADITNPQQAKLISECLIPAGTDNEFWVQGARLIFAACLTYLIKTKKDWGWNDIQKTMEYPEDELNKIFTTYYPAAAKLVEEKSKTTQGFLTILITNLGWIDELSTAWGKSKGGFSISNWVNNSDPQKVVIIAADPLHESISGPLCNAIFSLASQHILSLPDSDSRRILFAVDELGNLPQSAAIEKWLSLGRSKGIRTLAGTQSISQLYSIYGEHKTETILSLFSNVICLRLGSSGKSAQKASESLGNRIVKISVVSIDRSGNKSTTWQEVQKAVVPAECIIHLPQASKKGINGFLSVNGWNSVYEITWPYPQFNKITEEYQPASWLISKAKLKNKKVKRGSRGRNKQC